VSRIRRALRALDPDQRLAGLAAVALLATMVLPWYEKSVVVRGAFVDDSVSAFGTFSFVEAAVFLVSFGVLALLFARGERRGFHLPGGDGTVVAAAGVWAAVLLFWRVFDRPDAGGGAGATVGIQWGFFVAFVCAAALAAAGLRMRAAGRPEPPNPAAAAAASEDEDLWVAAPPARSRPREGRRPVERLPFSDLPRETPEDPPEMGRRRGS